MVKLTRIILWYHAYASMGRTRETMRGSIFYGEVALSEIIQFEDVEGGLGIWMKDAVKYIHIKKCKLSV